MKIDRTRLNPLYHQYSNQENRLTHALLHTIGSSKWLFSRFLIDIVRLPKSLIEGKYEISTQKAPFSQADNDPEKIGSIPDAWIVDDKSRVGIAVEVKDIKNSLRISQLNSHARRVANYEHPHLLVLTPDPKEPDKIIQFEQKVGESVKIVWRSWTEIYRWLMGLPAKNFSKKDKVEFLVMSMRQYLERRREVLGFQGIYFTSGFNVHEAKEILNAEMDELEPKVRKVYKDLGRRRPAITTMSQDSVWDCFGHEEGFTTDIHITLSINERAHDISITIPNSARRAWSNLRSIFSNEAKQDELFSILKDIRKTVPHIFIEFNQRHFVAQKIGYRDGFLEFNIDTLGPPFRKKSSKTKVFPVWFPALKEAIVNKKRINGQVMFKSRFFLNRTKGIEKSEFIEIAEETVKAYKPLYDFLGKPS